MSMNIMIAHSAKPFERTPIDDLAIQIKEEFVRLGDTVVILRFPFDRARNDNWDEQILGNSLLKIDNTSILITLNDPSCYIQHSRHVVWLQEKPIHTIPDLLSTARVIMTASKEIQEVLRGAKVERPLLHGIPVSTLEWKKIMKLIKSI